MKRVRGERVEFDPEWNPLRAKSVLVMGEILLKEGLRVEQVYRRLKGGGYLPIEIRWALSELSKPRPVAAAPSARDLGKLFDSANVIASA